MASDSVSSQVARELFLRAFIGGNPDVVGDTAARIAKRVEDLWLPASKTLYTSGEPADEHFFLVEGEIEVRDPRGGARRLGERSIVGILDVMQERPRIRTATATRDTHLLRLRANDWFDVLEDDFEFARGAVHNVARGLTQLHIALEGRGFEVSKTRPTRVRTGPLSFVDRTLLLRAVPPFRRASVQAAVDLVPHARVRELEEDEVLVARDSPKKSIFVVANGSIAVERGGSTLATFGPSSLLFGLGSFAPEPWAATARVTGGPARVLELDLEDIYDAMEEHFDLVKAAISQLSAERESLEPFEMADGVTPSSLTRQRA